VPAFFGVGDFELNSNSPTLKDSSPGSGNDLVDLVGTMDEIGLVSIMRYLIHSIAADCACVQMVLDFELIIKIQLFIE
jgi:hypothetical protein